MNQKYWKGKYGLMAGICLLACLTSCSADDADLNGSPNYNYETNGAHFGVNGTVTTKDGQPLENIQIEVPYNIADTEPYQYTEKLHTTKNGTFEWRRTDTPRDQVFRFILKDLDENRKGGQLKNDTIDVKFTLKQLSEAGGDGIWDFGSIIKNITITLEK